MTSAQQQFGLRLRRERESRGIGLDAIAASTKISKALFIGLEHGDLSRWPSGLYCRAHVCGYAAAIGLSPAEVLAEFNELYPDRSGEGPVASHTPYDPSDIAFRLTFARHAEPTVETRARRTTIAVAEAVVLFAVSAVLSRLTGAHLGWTAAVLAFLYYPVAIAVLGETAGFRAAASAAGAIRGLRSPNPSAVETDAAPEFADSVLPALSESGGMRMQAAGPLSAPMALESEQASDDSPSHEYRLH